jgi:hypothetical protein
MRQAQRGVSGVGWENFWGHHGFYEVFRRAGETGAVPHTVERMEESHYLYAGDVGAVKEKMHELWENGSPEYFVWWSDQGFLPFSEVRRNLQLFGEKIMPDFPG